MVDEMMSHDEEIPEPESDFGQEPGMVGQQEMYPEQQMWQSQPAQVQDSGAWPDRNQVGEYDQDGWEWLEFPPGSGTWYYRDPASGDWWLP